MVTPALWQETSEYVYRSVLSFNIYIFISSFDPLIKLLLSVAQNVSESCYNTIKESWTEINKIASQPSLLYTLLYCIWDTLLYSNSWPFYLHTGGISHIPAEVSCQCKALGRSPKPFSHLCLHGWWGFYRWRLWCQWIYSWERSSIPNTCGVQWGKFYFGSIEWGWMKLLSLLK